MKLTEITRRWLVNGWVAYGAKTPVVTMATLTSSSHDLGRNSFYQRLPEGYLNYMLKKYTDNPNGFYIVAPDSHFEYHFVYAQTLSQLKLKLKEMAEEQLIMLAPYLGFPSDGTVFHKLSPHEISDKFIQYIKLS